MGLLLWLRFCAGHNGFVGCRNSDETACIGNCNGTNHQSRGQDSGKCYLTFLETKIFLGDMDFKVAGTTNGITACQMDIKIKGLNFEILSQALDKAKQGRLHILEKLEETIPQARNEYKDSVPKMSKMVIEADFIGAVIGPGGKMIQAIQADTDTTIVLEEKEGKGHIEISGFDRNKIDQAINRIEAIAFTPKVGEEYDAIVRSIMPYGAFVEIAKGVEGLVHISEIEWRRLKTVEEVLNQGDSIRVKLIGIDEKTRRQTQTL